MENYANPNPALIQPMNQTVIQNIKLGYRKLLLTTILNDPLHNENLEKTQTNRHLGLRRRGQLPDLPGPRAAFSPPYPHPVKRGEPKSFPTLSISGRSSKCSRDQLLTVKWEFKPVNMVEVHGQSI
ncbi:hypothetical protein AVEN_189191-1 [Araneus ventricosus]|uniref:Uncharacterized protein n=1 Tax=Araneus ventricosus TaxID=182803 RepID=A0A4Y2KEG2_ARAVE|nr:hypothetical protein AVEN_189191-1 [Araneus ventricosus]